MAIMKGVFTSISGRVGNTIYCKSGPNQIIKTAFIPGNPKTAAQTTDRNLFASLNSEFKILNDELVQPFWKPFMTKSHKAWSSFLSVNKNNMVDTFDLTKVILTKGSLETVPINYVAFDETAKTLDVNWNSNTLTNGKSTDDVSLVVFDHDSNILLYYNLKCAVRSDSHFLITLLDAFTGYNLSVYAFASVDSASGLTIAQVSNSTSFDIGDYGLVMSFVDNAADTSTIRLKDLDDNACKVDWGDGNLQDISTSAETESLITPTYVKIYSRNGLSYLRSENNDFSFNLSFIPSALSYFRCTGSNTVSGDLADLPSVLTYFYCTGSNTVSGDIASLPSVLTHFVCTGSNTVSGDLADLPSALSYFRCYGSNTIFGDITNLPTLITYFNCRGNNVISGDIANLPSVLTYFDCTGSNTLSGDIAGLPSVLTYFNCQGSNTVSGDLAGLPSVLTYFYCWGSNTVSGDLADLPSVLTYFSCSGSNTISIYTSPRVWANLMGYILSLPAAGSGLDSTEIDNLLIDLSGVTTWAGSKVIYIAGNNAARTAASDAAVATLQGKGVTVTTN